MDDFLPLLAWLCYYGPTPLAGILAGLQAVQCRAPWQAFFVALLGTIGLATAFGAAVDFLPFGGWAVGPMWLFNLMVSPIAAVPLGAFCAYLVEKRSRPPSDPVG